MIAVVVGQYERFPQEALAITIFKDFIQSGACILNQFNKCLAVCLNCINTFLPGIF